MAQLYCICRKPDSGEWMVECDFCSDWFHGSCVKLNEADSELLDKYACPSCAAAKLGHTTWKRKCRLPECRLPAAFVVEGSRVLTKSKYCSPEHGEAFFRATLAAHSSDTDDGLHNAPLAPATLAAAVRAVASVAQFSTLGHALPDVAQSDIASLFLPDESARLLLLSQKRDAIQARLRYIEYKTSYIEYAKMRAQSQKTLCGFDRKLVWDEAEWQEWCDSDEGVKTLHSIREFQASAADRRLNDFKLEDKKGKRKKQQEPVYTLQEILAVVGDSTDPRQDEICTTEKRRCSRHASWQHIRSEEVVLDEQDCREALNGIQQEEHQIKQRVTIRALKDTVKDGGRCILVN